MRNYWIAGTAAVSLIAIGSAQAQDRLPRECRQEVVKLCGTDRATMRTCLRDKASELSENCRADISQRFEAARGTQSSGMKRGQGADASVVKSGAQEFAYGSAPLQKVDFWAGKTRNAPLVLFVHGGGWKRGDKNMMAGSAKLSHWQDLGYAVASANYRLVPDATVEDQAADIAAVTAYFHKNSEKLGIDANRIALIGHSAGAHLAAFVGTDPKWFAAAGLSMDDVAGIIPLDGAAYNVADQMGENSRLMGDTYEQAFGTDPVRQASLSPTMHTAGPNAPAFLILHVEREDGTRQSNALNAGLIAAGTDSSVVGIKGRGMVGHMQINRKLGEPDYPATPLVDAFLTKVFAQ